MDKDLSISRDHSAAMKGLLICLVVLGHNRFFCDVFPQSCWNWLYSFHVACFFILPFFYQEHTFSWSRVLTNAKRLLWPYTYMFGVLFLMDLFILKETTVDFGLCRTYITGDFYKLKKYIGFQYLWFLPAMFSMLAIKDVFTSANNVVKRILIVVGGAFFVLFWIFLYQQPYAKTINPALSQFAVFSFMLGFAMFFLGWCTRKIMKKIQIPSWLLIVGMVCSLVVLILSNDTSSFKYAYSFSRVLCPLLSFVLLYQTRGGVQPFGFKKVRSIFFAYLFVSSTH